MDAESFVVHVDSDGVAKMDVIHNACFRVPKPVMYFVPNWRCVKCHHVMVTDASPGETLGGAKCWCENCGAGPYPMPIMTSCV